ncbi:MAG: hypothetical protein R2709_16070 [Marmoricola sp.]
MAAAGVPAQARVCRATCADEARAALDTFGAPYVSRTMEVGGERGVVTSDRALALAHAASCEQVLIEEFLDGPEVSLGHRRCDRLSHAAGAQDFKRISDDDQGRRGRHGCTRRGRPMT